MFKQNTTDKHLKHLNKSCCSLELAETNEIENACYYMFYKGYGNIIALYWEYFSFC